MPERIVSPHNPAARPLLEPIVQAMYDTEVLSPDTQQIDFFQNPIGSLTTSGAAGTGVRKTLRFTNLETQGVLSHPRIHAVRGIRICLNEAPQTTSSDARSSTRSWSHPQLALLKWLQFRTYYLLSIGIKKYAEGPTFMFPGNVGIGSRASAVCLGQRLNTGSLGVVSEGLAAHGWGLYYGLGRNSITIPPGQNFRAQIVSGDSAGTLYNISSDAFPKGVNNGIHRLVTNYLDGFHGTEVQ